MIEREDLKEGEYYYVDYGSYYGLVKSLESNTFNCVGIIVNSGSGTFYKESTWTGKYLRILGYNERIWLDNCLKLGKFIPLEQIPQNSEFYPIF